ncbi:MAG TPA: hypothetical protein VER55_12865, partial [Ardenticatenaceae bacterium]|nr:hypothetical protein [Ardenticatenaceae bacterium]
IARHGRAFLHDYVGLNLFGMATSAADDLAGDWRFYLGVLREGLPGWWWLVPVAAAFTVWRLARERDARAMLLLGWTVVPFLLYSVAATKLAWYILPIYPGLALMVGWLFATLLPRRPLWQSLALAALLLGTAAWNRRTLEALHLSWAVKSVGWCAVNAAAPDETIAFFDPARGYQSNQRPFWNIRPSVRFYADRPMAALWDRAAVEGWLLGGGRFIWSDEAAAAQIADLVEVVGREGDQRLLRRADLAGSAVDGVGACRP